MYEKTLLCDAASLIMSSRVLSISQWTVFLPIICQLCIGYRRFFRTTTFCNNKRAAEQNWNCRAKEFRRKQVLICEWIQLGLRLLILVAHTELFGLINFAVVDCNEVSPTTPLGNIEFK